MEISVIGCVPRVPDKSVLVADPVECYENPGFPNDSQRKVSFTANKSINNIDASVVGLQSCQNAPINHVSDRGSKQTPTKEGTKHVIIVQSKDIADDEITLDMKVETEDELNLVPIVPETIGPINGICSSEDVAASVPVSLPVTMSSNRTETSSSVASINDPSSNDSYGAESIASLDAPSASDTSPDKKKRYLFQFRPKLSKIAVKNKNVITFRCFVCGGIYKQKFSLKRHYLRSHIDFRYISEADIANCKIPVPNYANEQHSNSDNCKTSNGRKRFRKSVNDVFLENNDSLLMPGLYRCHDCSDVFCDTEMQLKNHYNEHPDSVKKKFQCHICDASFFKKQILSRHLAGHGEKVTKNVCRKCNNVFPTKTELQRHVTSHIGQRKCKYCTKILSTSANRKRHEALHEGIKQHRCIHCEAYFAQRKDLDRHLRKQHSNFCRICSVCNKVFPTQDQMAVHLREKHTSSPKAQEIPSKPEVLDKPVVSKPVAPKPISCIVCKRVFQTLYAMMKHKRNAHPFHSRKRRHKKALKRKQKEQAAKLTADLNDYHKSPIRSPRAAKDKQARPNGRPGPKNLTKRERDELAKNADELAKNEERKFYNLVHENIAENLTSYLDGTAPQLSLKAYNFSDDLQFSSYLKERTQVPWAHYNFPPWYDVDTALKTKGREIKLLENMSPQEEQLYDATGLTPAHSSASVNNLQKNKSEMKKFSIPGEHQGNGRLTLEQQKALIGKSTISIVVCYICKEKFNSYPDFNEHCANNHPNVECLFIELEGDEEALPVVPPELCITNVSPVGSYFSCDVPPQLSEGALQCTKCKRQFKKCSELHEHITVCGNAGTSSKAYVPPRPNPQRRIKRTMKKRMTFEQQQAALEGNGFRIFERGSSLLYRIKSSDKMALIDKQFYKTGRPQTKSLTVDMNYFNTKPKKPVSTLSKRGRKSYALVSSMYRNGTIQAARNVQSISKRGRKSYATQPFMYKSPSASECLDCRMIFDSIQDLNNHIQSSCIMRSNKRKEMLKSTPNNVKKDLNKTVFQLPSKSLGINRFPKSSSYAGISTLGKSASSINDICSSDEGGLEDIPIDLSRNAKFNSPLTLNRSHAGETKSAVQIAMEKALNFVEKMKNNQMTQSSNPPAVGNQTTGTGLVFPIPKLVTQKKVGRPRKLKKVTPPTPLLVQNSVSPDIVKKKIINSKPGKLEETIQKLTVRSREKQMQNSLTLGDVSSVKRNILPSSDNQLSNVSNISLAQPAICRSETISVKEKSEALAVNIAAGLVKNSIPCNDLPAFEVSTSSQDNDKPKTNENSNITNDGQILSIKEHNDSVIENMLGKDPGENKKDTQVLPTVPNTEFSLVEPNKDNQIDNQSPNQGRSSPTFESILKVINQKLHSEEQESSHLDDAGISWLEDEQFEIPPSRSKLNISVTSSSILLSNTENPNIETKLCATKVLQDASQNILPASLQDFCHKSVEKTSESASSNMTFESNQTASVNNNSIAVDSASNLELNPESEKSKLSPEIKISTGKPNSAMKTDMSIKPGVKKVTFTEALLDTSLVSPLKKKDIDSSPIRRGPGRPRKRISDTDTESSQDNKSINTASSESKADTLEPVSENELVMPIASDLETAELVKSPNEDGTQTNQESSSSKENNDNEVLIAPNSSEYDKSNIATETELPPLSLRNFRTKSKQVSPNVDGVQSVSLPSSSVTTEFGKNLASRMKEKMRLSFDPDASKVSSSGTEDSSLSIGADISDTNFPISIEDLKKAVKKEGESAEKIHYCPYCMLEFAYLTNFRRHIKRCQARPDKKITDPVPGTSSTHLQHLPKKDEVDYSMLNLYRHQSRQTQMMKEVVTINNPPIKAPISKYECTICHRIFLNLFNFMQHKTQHKLTVTKNNQENDDMMDEMEFFDNQVPENLEKFEGETSELIPSDEKEIEAREGENENLTPVSFENEISDEKNAENVDQPMEAANDSITEEIVDQGSLTVKRKKRGRPVGWRKSVNFLQENSENKDIPSDSNPTDKNDSALLAKETLQAEVSDGLAIFSSKLKVKNIKEMLKSKLGKMPARKKRKLEEDNCNEFIPQGATPQSYLLPTKEAVKDLPKHSSVKGTSVPQNDFSNASEGVPQDLKNPLLKSEKIEVKIPITESSPNKRQRGRSAVASPGVLKTSTAKSVSPVKRKPGRPSRNLLSAPSTSQPSRGNYSQSSIRNTRKMIAVARNIDSSDSESEKKKVEVPTKKKIHFKSCALCKEKFASNLVLHRHIQLVHSRRMQPVASKADTGKILKKIPPKSPPTQVSAVVRRSTSPQKKVSTMKAGCTICKKEFHSALLLRSHIQVRHPKLHESNIAKTEPLTANSENSDAIENKLDVPLKVDQLQPSTAVGATEVNNGASEGDNVPKKAQKHKVCALCKAKFVTSMLLRNHLQTVHSRKSDVQEAAKSALSRRSLPVATKSGQSPISSPVKAKGNTTPDRSSLSRQCRKPLPPMKRKRIKKEPLEQQAVKKSKI